MPHRFVWNSIKWGVKTGIGRFNRFLMYRVFSLKDTPHRIALGVAIGMFIAWTPTIPFQMILTVALSALFRANKFVGLPFVWVTNPVTLIPIYGPNYVIGCWILGGDYTWGRFMHAMSKSMDFSMGFFELTKTWWEATLSIFAPLWIGSILMGLIVGSVSYGLIFYGVVNFRKVYHHIHDGHAKAPPAETGAQIPADVSPPPGLEGQQRPAPEKPEDVQEQRNS